MRRVVVYIQGMGGSPDEYLHFVPLFPGYSVIGFDYRSQTPWDAQEEFDVFFRQISSEYDSIDVIANSIGAYFFLVSHEFAKLRMLFLISPIIDMEYLIRSMMKRNEVSEDELRERGVINGADGETLSWEYLSWVREHPLTDAPVSAILRGSLDSLQPDEIVSDYASRSGSYLTVLDEGEHWFHTEEQMEFLDRWIVDTLDKRELLTQ